MADTKTLISLSRVNADGSLNYIYPKTVASQVFTDENTGKTVADHVADTNVHLSAAERTALTKTNTAEGYVKLDENGFVPASMINPSVIAVNTEFADITALLAASTTDVIEGELVMVTDASADSTVASGWAIYRRKVGATDLTKLDSWQKIAEAESLDVVVSWDNIQGKPTSAVADIDDAVAKKHAHANAAVLDLLTQGGTQEAPTLNFSGKELAYTADVNKIFLTTDASSLTGTKAGDLVLVQTGTLA